MWSICIIHVGVDPIRPTKDLHLYNRAMKVLFLVASCAILSSAITFAYFQFEPREWWEVESNVCLSAASSVNATVWEVTVAGVSGAHDLRNYRAVLMENGGAVDSIDPLRSHTSTQLQFIDYSYGNYSADGKLGVGDYFLITCGLARDYELVIIGKYTDEMRGWEEWDTHPGDVGFSEPMQINGTHWEVTVTHGPGLGLGNPAEFDAVLQRNGSWEDELSPLEEGSSAYITFTDANGDDLVNYPDNFTIACEPESSYTLIVIWEYYGDETGRIEWETYEPSVSFGTPYYVDHDHWFVSVIDVDRERGLDFFVAVLQKSGSWEDELSPLSEKWSVHLWFLDLFDHEVLSTGDVFGFSCEPWSSYELIILWKYSGNEIGRVEWTT